MAEEIKEPKSEEETSASESSPEETQAKPDDKPEKPEEKLKETPEVSEESEKVELSKEEYDALLKAKEVGETYREENIKYRQMEKDNRLKNLTPKPEEPEQPLEQVDNQEDIQKDYLSKRANVIHKITEDIKSLSDDQWTKIKNKIPGTLDSVYMESVKNGNYVAEGQLEQEARDLIEWAKGSDNTQEVERARAEGAADAIKAEQADIGTVISPQKPTAKGVTEEDKQVAELTKEYPPQFQVSEERAKEIRENREARKKNW
ncbi:MAG: hypothetical protein ACTSPI_15900 [Candidatus Heimdallarchaeaceae archaeon]